MYKLAVEVFNAYDESKGDDKVLQTLLERHKAVIKMPSTPATSTQTSASTPVTSALTPALTPAQTSDVSPSGPKTRVNQPQGQETEVQAKVEGHVMPQNPEGQGGPQGGQGAPQATFAAPKTPLDRWMETDG